jgi:peptide chain release factor 2
MSTRAKHENCTRRFEKFQQEISDVNELIALSSSKQDDDDIIDLINSLDSRLREFELEQMLSDEIDESSAIISINAGQGGSDAQDWCEMLFRMYARWCLKKGFTVLIIDSHPSGTGGLLSVTATVTGRYAYGLLRAENGVHRIIRISPFGGGRHTSFSSVATTPDLNDKDFADIEIRDEDLKIDVYRSSGAGGQHVNKTESAVRITHLPTGIVVACQSERSQHKNKSTAMKVLAGKLYEKARQEREAEFTKNFESNKMKISFGSQVRSYTLNPFTMVKDERTDLKITNVQSVLDGNIDEFIEAYLMIK